MTSNRKDMYASISQEKIDDLMAIYDDYLYMARAHEQSILLTPDSELATKQIEDMYSDGFDFPWYTKQTNEVEKKEFADFAVNDSVGNGKSTYIFLKHVKDEENSYEAPIFIPHSYESILLGMPLPSKIEHFNMIFPENATLGDTELIIDGRYKVVYVVEKDKDKLLKDCMSDPDLQTKIAIMINMGEYYRQNEYVTDENLQKKFMLTYAEEKIIINENNILEMIGSFSEVVKDICHEKYRGRNGKDDVIRAQREGFLNLPDNFLEYDDIRNYIRHQWECVQKWELFMPDKQKNLEEKHTRRVNSYLKYCDKTIYQRMKSYIEVLYQMQQIVAEVKPNRLIRGRSESRNKFKKRLKETMALNPNMPIEAELNYLPMYKEFDILKKDVCKIMPDVKIIDDVLENSGKYEQMYNRIEDYRTRFDFLQSLHGIECMVVGLCVTHGKISNDNGKNLNTFDALDYLRKNGIITYDEQRKWRKYTLMRNVLAHQYFSDDLRKELHSVEKQFHQDLKEFIKKLNDKSPEMRKLQNGVYEYTNFDGKVVELDHKKHTVLSNGEASVLQIKHQEKKETVNKKFEAEPKKNNSGKVVVKTTEDGNIKGVRLQGDIYIDMISRRIRWGDAARWHTNAEGSNYLHAGRSVLRTDKNLYLKEYCVGKSELSFRGGDNLLIDNRHRLILDFSKRIKEFRYKDESNNFIKTVFEHKSNGTDRISFEDGTNVLISGNDISVSHNGIVLNYDNQKEFAASYDTPQKLPPSLNKHGNER